MPCPKMGTTTSVIKLSQHKNDFGKRKECYFATNHHELVSWKALDHPALFDHLFRNIYTHIFDRECDALQVSGDRYSKGANIGGHATIGEYATIGAHATIEPHV